MLRAVVEVDVAVLPELHADIADAVFSRADESLPSASFQTRSPTLAHWGGAWATKLAVIARLQLIVTVTGFMLPLRRPLASLQPAKR